MSRESFRVLLSGTAELDPANPLHQELSAAGCELVFAMPKSTEELISAARDADAIVAGGRFPAEVINQLERCRMLMRTGVGVDNIDVAAATARGILVVNVPDSWVEEVANHAITLLLVCHRRIVPLTRIVQAGRWHGDAGRRVLQGIHRLSSQTLGLIGLGNIGSAVAIRARAFGLTVLAFDPYVSKDHAASVGATLTPLDELLRASDYVSLHTPLTQETLHMIGERELDLMKSSAALINTSRGGVIDEAAIARGLKAGKPAVAALDVVEREPMAPGHPLLSLDNVIMTPHAAYYSDEALAWCFRQSAREIISMMHGESPRPVAVINKDLLRSRAHAASAAG
jgi:D-3-phosphoglycerate dehydrogenase